MGGRELKGKDAWIHPAGLLSPPWIYHLLLIRGSRLCLMWTSLSCMLAGKGLSDTGAQLVSSGAEPGRGGGGM